MYARELLRHALTEIAFPNSLASFCALHLRTAVGKTPVNYNIKPEFVHLDKGSGSESLRVANG